LRRLMSWQRIGRIALVKFGTLAPRGLLCTSNLALI
jgi:hypothetical protein